MENFKKYIAIVRGMTDGKWILKKSKDGLLIKNDATISDIDGWTFWCDYTDFKRVWLDEGMNPNNDEYEDDLFMESFDTFEDAIYWLENNHTYISAPDYRF
jgi:hypothetical protein